MASSSVCINDSLRDDELRAILSRLETAKEKEVFGLVCKRWLRLQSSERRKLCARAGPHMLRKVAARFGRLHELDLSQSASRSFYPGVTDSDLSFIANAFPCLRLLNLRDCKSITDTGMAAIGCGLSSLQFLDVSNCRKLTDKGLSAVAEGCCDLRSLHLSGCKSVTDAVLRTVSKNCHNLEAFGLQGCTNITDSGLILLVAGCQKIKYLDVNKCSNVGDEGISSVSQACSYLETLIIGGCRDVSDLSINLLATACGQSLKNLRMDWCVNVSDSSLNCILSHCRNLEVLSIGCCEEVTDAAFQGLGNDGFELILKVLKVSNCPKITVAGIGLLLDLCNSLEYLDVRSCPNVTKAGCDEAGLQFPGYCKVNFSGSITEPDILL